MALAPKAVLLATFMSLPPPPAVIVPQTDPTTLSETSFLLVPPIPISQGPSKTDIY